MAAVSAAAYWYTKIRGVIDKLNATSVKMGEMLGKIGSRCGATPQEQAQLSGK